jgi:cytoplasmic iron level regulating protein YaaA (DUF328/UPF0246 family)
MLLVISPAKSLDFESPLPTQQHTQSDFLEQSQTLINQARELSPAQIGSMMKISDKLAPLHSLLKATCIKAWKQKRLVMLTTSSPSSTYEFSLGYMACSAHWI